MIKSKPTLLICANKTWNIVNFRMELIEYLQKIGYQIYILSDDENINYSQFEQLGIEKISLNLKKNSLNPVNIVKIIWQYYLIIKRLKPNAVLTFTTQTNVLVSIVSLFHKMNLLVNITGLGSMFIKNKVVAFLMLKIYRIIFLRVQKVFLQNQDDYELFVSQVIPQTKAVRVNGSGVNLLKFPYQPITLESIKQKKQLHFLFVGRLIKDKGILEYIQAAKQLNSMSLKRKTHFQVLGDFDQSNRSNTNPNTINKLMQQAQIEYLGCQKDILDFLQKADVVVLPSYREGTPKSILEALALGKPIITTNTAGCRETVIENQNGFFCEVGNAQDLINAIVKMTQIEPERLHQFSQESYKLAQKKFNIDFVLYKYEKHLKLFSEDNTLL